MEGNHILFLAPSARIDPLNPQDSTTLHCSDELKEGSVDLEGIGKSIWLFNPSNILQLLVFGR